MSNIRKNLHRDLETLRLLKRGYTKTNGGDFRRARQSNPNPMVSITHEYVENSNNKRLGDFRLIDNDTKSVSPELVQLFNSAGVQKRQEEVIRQKEPNMLSYLKGWQSPYGYAAWPWVFHWMSRLRQEGFTPMEQDVANRLRENERENCLEEAHLIGDEMMINKAEPIYLTKEILDDFYRTDIPSFDAVQNEVLPSFVLMLPKNSISIIDHNANCEHSVTRDTRAILVVTNNCYRKRLRHHYEEFLTSFTEDQVGRHCETFINDKLNPINYIDDERDGYMFESGFKMLALDNKCGAVFADFNWKDGTKNFEIFESENTKKIQEEYKKMPNSIKTTGSIADSYAGLINVVANTILTMSHHTEYVSVKSPMTPRATGFNQVGQEIPPQPTTWIGEGYNNTKTRYEYPDSHTPTKGTSPRAHWRRGHQRWVCQGPKRKQRVLKWIKPVYVNGANAS
jgi:hypothetical protein